MVMIVKMVMMDVDVDVDVYDGWMGDSRSSMDRMVIMVNDSDNRRQSATINDVAINK